MSDDDLQRILVMLRADITHLLRRVDSINVQHRWQQEQLDVLGGRLKALEERR